MASNNISRRQALTVAAGIAAAAGADGVFAAAPRRPNILWVVSEDNNPFIGCYGDKLARTPTIDALAQHGILYRNVYSNAPVCAPSRFGILTGIYPESCAPANQMRAVAQFPREFATYPEFMRKAGYWCTNSAKTDYNCSVDPAAIWDGQGKEAHWRSRPDDRPFMAVFNYGVSHESQLIGVTEGAVQPTQVRIPGYLPDTPGIRRDYASYYNLIEKMDGQIAARLAELDADGLADDTIVFYYSDNGGVLPRSKRYCYDEGHRCAMVVRVPDKWRHLAPVGPGSSIDTPVSFIDLAPTVLSIAGLAAPAQMQGRAFLGDRIQPPVGLSFGMRNRMDERIDFCRTVTDGRWRYIRNYMPHRPWGQHQAFAWQLRSYQEWDATHREGKLNPAQARFFGQKPYEELYELGSDRDQLVNLVGDGSAAAVLRRMRSAIDEQMLSINDNGFLPEGMAGEGFIPSRDRRVYPLRRVMALASAAARRDPRKLALLRGNLTSPIPVLRYWAATGLLMLGDKAAAARAELRALASGDPSPHVRIAGAEAVAGLGDGALALSVLAPLARDASSWQLQLHALNALTFMPSQPAILPLAREVAISEVLYVRSAARYLAATLDGSFTPAMRIFDLQLMLKKMKESGGEA